jgi:hypothetical protein
MERSAQELIPNTTPEERQRSVPPIPARHDIPHRVFTYDLDEVTYEFDQETTTGADVMAAGGVPISEGIIQILPDGTRETIAPDTMIFLTTGAQFRRRPRFKRG